MIPKQGETRTRNSAHRATDGTRQATEGTAQKAADTCYDAKIENSGAKKDTRNCWRFTEDPL